MLHFENERIRELLFEGLIGLEKESLRVTGDGFMSLTPHPFDADDPHIVRDFCENQTEINTSPRPTAKEAYEELMLYTERIRRTLFEMEEREYLWPFSNPPYIRDEKSIPIARFTGKDKVKTEYREYLSNRYGRYKMTFSGIHFNYSFGERLLKEDFKLSGYGSLKEYKDAFYVSLAAKALAFNWIVVAITAASPLLDSSYFEKGTFGQDVFNGMASSRCSEIGYWNFFTPLLDYTDIRSYTESIDSIVEHELIRSPSELYFPVRIKPRGSYSGKGLIEDGADHIELRMIDLNPLDEAGMDIRDIFFLQLLLIYLSCRPDRLMDPNTQVESIANTKNAARFDLKTVRIIGGSEPVSIAAGARRVIDRMRLFFEDFHRDDIEKTLDFQREKFTEIENRYAWKVRQRFSGGFVEKGMEILRK